MRLMVLTFEPSVCPSCAQPMEWTAELQQQFNAGAVFHCKCGTAFAHVEEGVARRYVPMRYRMEPIAKSRLLEDVLHGRTPYSRTA